jgi:DNA-binding NarL/FixJ family response regulator
MIQKDIFLNPFIVVMSGQCDKESVNRAIECGANKFMNKPSPINELAHAI